VSRPPPDTGSDAVAQRQLGGLAAHRGSGSRNGCSPAFSKLNSITSAALPADTIRRSRLRRRSSARAHRPVAKRSLRVYSPTCPHQRLTAHSLPNVVTGYAACCPQEPTVRLLAEERQVSSPSSGCIS
jgi:hypothetical protein